MPHTLLKNARLIDGIADHAQAGVSILINGERISQVASGEIPVPPDTQVIDLDGKTVLPGLIDTHVHTTFMDKESLPLFLAAGVTTARDVGGKLEKVKQLKDELNSGSLLGPRLFICGPLLDGADSSFDPQRPVCRAAGQHPLSRGGAGQNRQSAGGRRGRCQAVFHPAAGHRQGGNRLCG